MSHIIMFTYHYVVVLVLVINKNISMRKEFHINEINLFSKSAKEKSHNNMCMIP